MLYLFNFMCCLLCVWNTFIQILKNKIVLLNAVASFFHELVHFTVHCFPISFPVGMVNIISVWAFVRTLYEKETFSVTSWFLTPNTFRRHHCWPWCGLCLGPAPGTTLPGAWCLLFSRDFLCVFKYLFAIYFKCNLYMIHVNVR